MVTAETPGPISNGEMNLLLSQQTHRLYLIGDVVYDYVFRVCRQTKFLYSLSVQVVVDRKSREPQIEFSWVAEDRHNEVS